MNKILCSTGTMIGRPNGRDITLLREHYGALLCDGLEFMMYDTWYEKQDEILRVMSKIPLPVPVFHVEKSIGSLVARDEKDALETALARFTVNCKMGKELGSETLVLHLWNGPESDTNIARNLACYPLFDEIARANGLLLTVENVVCSREDPLTHLKSLTQTFPNAFFTFDTKMAAFHCQLDQLYEEKNREIFARVRHVHVNDYGGGYKDWNNLKTLHVGDGHVDFDRFFDFLRKMHYTGNFTIEATSFDGSGTIYCDQLNRSIRMLRKWID